MKIAVVGAGAMGSIYAALLSEAGNSVWAIDPNQAHLDAINRHGLSLTGPQGTQRFDRITAVPDAAAVGGQVDLVVLATKALYVPQAVQNLASILGPATTVLAMQNGLGAAERVQQNLPETAHEVHVALGVAQGFGASVEAPGQVRFANMKLMRFGETVDGDSPVMEALARTWREAGFQAQAYANLRQLIWEKFICNVTLSAPCTIFRQSVGAMKAVPEQWQIALNCGLEAVAVGRALGVPFSFDDAETYIGAFADSVAGAKPSMLQDFEARRRSEIDVINGRVPIEAAKVGLSAPLNQTLADLVRAQEAAF
ncbi:2-dehydropantoate 2-reductase [bacterium]|nr:2-dehydropantoate 2-reductase [bacterium]